MVTFGRIELTGNDLRPVIIVPVYFANYTFFFGM
jgi:hypothetical protein